MAWRNSVMEPSKSHDSIIEPVSFDVVFIPLLAFDRAGNRLGFGGGFYDTFLESVRCPKIGLAYSFQETESVPVEPHDCGLDCIITEKEVIRVG